MRLVRVLI
jgi:hypothetical protein